MCSVSCLYLNAPCHWADERMTQLFKRWNSTERSWRANVRLNEIHVASISFNRFPFQRWVSTVYGLCFVISTNQTNISYDIPIRTSNTFWLAKMYYFCVNQSMPWQKLISVSACHVPPTLWCQWMKINILIFNSIQAFIFQEFDITSAFNSITDFRYFVFSFSSIVFEVSTDSVDFRSLHLDTPSCGNNNVKTVRWMNFLFQIFVSRQIGVRLVKLTLDICFWKLSPFRGNIVSFTGKRTFSSITIYNISASEMICGCLSFQSASRKCAGKICRGTRICRVATERKI